MKRKNEGITLITLVITIIVLLILSSIATYSGINIIKSSEFTTFTTELKIMQTQINGIYQKYKNNESIEINGTIYYGEADKSDTTKNTILSIGESITEGSIAGQANKVFTESASEITSQEGYRYWTKDLLKSLGIEGVEQDFFINIEKRSVISYKGLEYEGKTYYTLDQIPNGLYNVEYENPNTGKPSFSVTETKQGDNKWRIDIFDIVYEYGYIDKWQVKYKITGEDYWNTTEDLSFILREPGKYSIMIANGEIESDPQIILIGGSYYDNIARVNTPNINEEMLPVYWDDTNQEKELTSTSSEEEWDNWYKYVAGDNSTDSKNSNWANAKTSDGSYWVWIPRYEYKITAAPSTTASSTNAGKIKVKFIPITQTIADEGYTIHPAFTANVNNGGWRSELAGIWVAKYEMSMETNGSHTETSSTTIGNVPISNSVKMASKPNRSSWRNINTANSFTNAYNYDRSKESHLMKNSEWGAVAYLAHSQYGRNGNEVTINNSSSYITGNAGESVSAGSKTGTTNAYDTAAGMLASSTGNIYGIYDLNGGAWERTAVFNSAYSGNYFTETSYIDAQGNNFASTGGTSTEYATAYSNTTRTGQEDFTVGTVSIIGDAIQEVYVSSDRGWFDDTSNFILNWAPFLNRGGDCRSVSWAGIFCSDDSLGDAYYHSTFRVVLVCA